MLRETLAQSSHYTYVLNENRSTHPTQRCDGISQGSCQVQGPSLPLSLDPSFLATRKNKTLHRWFFFFPRVSLSLRRAECLGCWQHISQWQHLLYLPLSKPARWLREMHTTSNKETGHLRPQSGHRSPQRTWGTLCSFTKFKIRFINVNCTTPEAKYILRT